ncbi:MAG TPA: ABC transporter permease [Actinomycetota bacterium]
MSEPAAPTAAAPAPGPGPEPEQPRPGRWAALGRFAPTESAGSAILVTVLAFVTALAIGALVIVFSDPDVLSKYGYFFARPSDALSASWNEITATYGALFSGSLGSPSQIAHALASGDAARIQQSFYPLSETIVAATPLIFTGLAVALAFRAGMFNIGAEGQLFVGGLLAGLVGFAWHLPPGIHLVVALLAGLAGGALWGFVPGFLKARTGAHEVITTIMMNYIAISLSFYLLSSSLYRRPGRTDPISKIVDTNARLPHLAGANLRLHSGIILAVLVTWAVAWLLKRSTIGFELRAVGLNPDAARTAGMNIGRTYILAMMLAGALAGLGGANQVLGVQYTLAPGFSANLGFDAITLALLGRANPWGVFAAALLFGMLRAGAVQMQAATGTPVDMVVVIQALIIVFVAAPALVRAIYRIKVKDVSGTQPVSGGWGG